jgi:sulfite oxidase
MARRMLSMDYADEPPHSELLIVQGTKPLNAEPDASALVEFQLTPEDLCYCRNHGPVRELDEEDFRVTVNGGVEKELKLSMHDLRSLFPMVHVVAALQVHKPYLCQKVLTNHP